MSLRRADPRFLLPAAPRRALVLGGLGEWVAGLSQAGIAVGGSRPDLVVAPVSLAVEAVRVGAASIVLEGRGGRHALRRAGVSGDRFLVRPRRERPEVLLPLDRPRAATSAVTGWSAADTRTRRARNRVARSLLRAGMLPEVEPVTTVAPGGTTPYVLAAVTAELDLPRDAEAFLTLGQGDELSRNVFHVLPPDGPEPAWVVKFGRVAGHAAPFDRDERGLVLAAGAGDVVARRAPTLLGRLEVGGVHVSVETAARGSKLRELLRAPTARARKLALVERVAAWLVDVAVATAAPPEALAPQRRRLAEEVLPAWAAAGAPPDLADGLPPIPAVLQHNDVGTWNVVATRDGDFTLVDWESACRHGLPLWDLVYFLRDALGVVDGAVEPDEQDDHALRLFRGELASSQTLFAWIRRGAASLEVPAAAVGPIVTLAWLHHGLSHRARARELEREGHARAAALPAAERVAPLWLADAALGPSWERWHAS